MIPLPYRCLIRAAGWLVPRSKRREWRREWEAELWHRWEAGASRGDLWHHASGVFRDAVWFLERERKTRGYDPFRRPLRMEALFLAIAILACLVSGTFRAPRLPYAAPAELVVFERDIAFPGAISPQIDPKLLTVWKKGASFSAIVPYRIMREPDLAFYTSPGFFEVLGAKPMLGRTFSADDPSNVTVLPYDTWRTRYRSDPGIAGKWVHIGLGQYRVLGVMPPEFWFRTKSVRFFAPFTWKTRAGGIVARLNAGVRIPEAQDEVRRSARTVAARSVSESLRVKPLVPDTRWLTLWFGVKIALLAAILGLGFLAWRRFGGWRYWSLLGARAFCTVLGLFLLHQSFSGPSAFGQLSNSLFGFWLFLLLCSSAVCLLATDHLGRCPVCFGKLRKPVAIGSWASQILDQPATEYLCPAGHGTLYVAETGNAPDYWTVLDESWQEFFAPGDR